LKFSYFRYVFWDHSKYRNIVWVRFSTATELWIFEIQVWFSRNL